MKKLALLLTVCLLAWSALAGCQTQKRPSPQSPAAPRLPPAPPPKRGTRWCCALRTALNRTPYELENYLKATGVETEYEFFSAAQ